MYDEIQRKLARLSARKPYGESVEAYLAETDLTDWIFSCLRLSGSDLTRESVQKILRGEIVSDVALNQHQQLYSCTGAMKRLQDMKEMRYDLLCDSGIRKLYQVVFQREGEYRRRDPILPQWDYMPPHFSEVEEQMGLFYSQVAQEDHNPLMRACRIHMKLLEIYPFGQESEDLARYALLYEMLCADLPVTVISMSEQEYNVCVMNYLKTDDPLPFYMSMERAVYNKVEVMLQMTASDDMER